MVVLGDASLQVGDKSQAVGAWEAALKLPAASHTDAYSRLEAYYRKTADLTALKGVLHAHLQEAPRDAQALYLLGLASLTDHPEKSTGYLNLAGSIDPTYEPRVQSIEAGILLAGQQTDRAYQLLLLSRALGTAGEWDFACLLAKSAVDTDPKNGDARAFWGEALQQTGQDGFPELQAAARISPDSVFVEGLEAVYWLGQDKPYRAVPYLEGAAKQEPGNPVWEAQLGDALARMGKLDDAAASYQKAAALAPNNPVYLQLQAKFCLKYNYQVGETGLPAARQALLLDDKNTEALDLMGQVFLALEDSVSARRFFERAVAADPKNPDAQLHLGSLLLQLGDPAGARPYLRMASKLQPATSAAQQADRLLKQYYP